MDEDGNIISSYQLGDTCGEPTVMIDFSYCPGIPSASPSISPSTSAAPSGTCYASVVKIQSTTSQALQFYEVEVVSGGTNVALQGTATQSSAFGGFTEFFDASYAID
eukprot:scaffold114993_cov89-Cyclotella_meneghiniana.AAC.1